MMDCGLVRSFCETMANEECDDELSSRFRMDQ